MWNICSLLFINLKIWGICIAFTYYCEQIRIGRNNFPVLHGTILKLFEPNSSLYSLTESNPRIEYESPLSTFVWRMYKQSHTIPQGPGKGNTKFQSKPDIRMALWLHKGNEATLTDAASWVLDWATWQKVNVRQPYPVTSKAPASSQSLILDVIWCDLQM